MVTEKRKAFLNLLRKMSKKGHYETLEFIAAEEPVHYSEILHFDMTSEVVKTRSSVIIIVRNLLKMGLLERQVIDSQPVRTQYRLSEKGLKILDCLNKMESF
jgi:DNA-binding HxlR family transcriptional regulator